MGVSNQDGDGILNNQKLWYKQPAERWEDADIPVGPGRGSAAGSIVAYLLRITNIEPLHCL